MVQKATFLNGGYVLHKVRIEGSKCKFSVWCTPDGLVHQAARFDAKARECEVTPAQREALEIVAMRYK